MSQFRFGKSRTLTIALTLLAVLTPVLLTSIVFAQTEASTAKTLDPAAIKWAFMAAALSVGTACLGAAIAVAYIGAAAVAAVAEKPQLAGRTLIFVGLAEGIAIYGLIIAIMILGKI
ncbi:MAG: ATP synthase subunit C [Candidatus Hydrogenedentes bacterium]|nr:ATP synthase subunit C [Candidatus Hydrogenedentota bacterium]